MTNSTVIARPAAPPAAPAKAKAKKKVTFRSGKRSVSGWIRADLVQYAEEVAHAKGRSIQSVLQDALELFKAQHGTAATAGAGAAAHPDPAVMAEGP